MATEPLAARLPDTCKGGAQQRKVGTVGKRVQRPQLTLHQARALSIEVVSRTAGLSRLGPAHPHSGELPSLQVTHTLTEAP